jgi:hypothetical protein
MSTEVKSYYNSKPSPADVAKKHVLKNYAGKMTRLEIENKRGHFAVHQGDAERWLSIVDKEGIPGVTQKFSNPKLGSLDVRFKMALDAIRKFLQP